jgi:hypothetical protein
MNQMRFECGVDVGALVKTGRKAAAEGFVGGAGFAGRDQYRLHGADDAVKCVHDGW